MARVQMSVYVTEEVAARLRDASGVAGVPMGRHVGDMLESLIDSVEYVSVKLAEARRQPAEALSRVRAIDSALQLGGGLDAVVDASPAARGARGRTASAASSPPSNTGATLAHPVPGRGATRAKN